MREQRVYAPSILLSDRKALPVHRGPAMGRNSNSIKAHMNKHIADMIVIAAVGGFATAVQGSDDLDQRAFPLITAQPIDQAVPMGGRVEFTVGATNADQFQWLRNGAPIDGQTNSSLTLQNIGTNDVAYYSCAVLKGGEFVPTRAASLNIYTTDGAGGIVVFSFPVSGGGSQGTCPGAYTGYANYTKTFSQGWGWAPSANTTIHTASDGAGRTDTKVEYVGRYLDSGCDQTTVTVPDPTFSPKYRFTIYFTNNVPTNAYPINLSGFDP